MRQYHCEAIGHPSPIEDITRIYGPYKVIVHLPYDSKTEIPIVETRELIQVHEFVERRLNCVFHADLASIGSLHKSCCSINRGALLLCWIYRVILCILKLS